MKKYLKIVTIIVSILFLSMAFLSLHKKIFTPNVEDLSITFFNIDTKNFKIKGDAAYYIQYSYCGKNCVEVIVNGEIFDDWHDITLQVSDGLIPDKSRFVIVPVFKNNFNSVIEVKDLYVNNKLISAEKQTLYFKDYIKIFMNNSIFVKENQVKINIKVKQVDYSFYYLSTVILGILLIFLLFYKNLSKLFFLLSFSIIIFAIICFIVDFITNNNFSITQILLGATLVSKDIISIHYKYVLIGLFFIGNIFCFCAHYKKTVYPILLITSLIFILNKTSFFYISSNEGFYRENYLIPKITPPKKLKNIIYISLESFTDILLDKNYFSENLLPNLSSLSKEGISFHNYMQTFGTAPTIPSYQSVVCGLHNDNNGITYDTDGLRNSKCIVDILSKYNYTNTFLIGSSINVEGVKYLILNHAYNKYYDKSYFFKNNTDIFTSDKTIKDRVLFEKAKEVINDTKNRPFFISIITSDTHYPAFVDTNCENTGNVFNDSYKCSDKNVYDFIMWLKSQPVYKDTVVILSGDHPIWLKWQEINPDLKKIQPKQHVWNLILNSSIKNHPDKFYSMFDMAPTILESAGFTLNERRFGLGYSLFSNEKTLFQKVPNLYDELLRNQYEYVKLFKLGGKNEN